MGRDERERHCYALDRSPPVAANADYMLIFIILLCLEFIEP